MNWLRQSSYDRKQDRPWSGGFGSFARRGSYAAPRQYSKAQALEEKIRESKRQFERNGNFVTSAPYGYRLPSDREIKDALKSHSVKASPSFGFVRDICSMAMGGSINPSSVWGPIVDRLAEERFKVSKRNNGENQSLGNIRKKIVDNVNGLSNFLRTLNFKAVPGASALQKAVWIIKALEKSGNADIDYENLDSTVLPVLSTAKSASAAKEVESIYNDFNSLDAEDYALILADREKGSEVEHSEDEVDIQKAVLEELLGSTVKSQMAKIANTLKELEGLSVVPVYETRPDANGEDVRRRHIKDLHELGKIEKQNWALFLLAPELFWQKVLSHELYVRERISRKKEKQLLYILIDCSGSMSENNGRRIGTACGVLMNRLKAVIKGEAELYYRFFDGGIYKEVHVKTKEDAVKAMKAVIKANYSGASTDINWAVRSAAERVNEIMKDGRLVKPQIAIVTDGGDSINLTKKDLNGAVLHSILCVSSNSDLSKLAKDSGGINLRVGCD